MHSCNAKASEEGESLLAAFLLEYLEGDGGVLDGDDHPAVVQVKDVMLLLKNLQKKPHRTVKGATSRVGKSFAESPSAVEETPDGRRTDLERGEGKRE